MHYPVDHVMHYSGFAIVRPCPGLVLRLSCMDPGSATHTLAQLRTLLCQPQPESALGLVLPCTEPDPALPALSLTVLFGCPCLDKSLKQSCTYGYTLENLNPPNTSVFCSCVVLRCVTIRHDAILIICHVIP